MQVQFFTLLIFASGLSSFALNQRELNPEELEQKEKLRHSVILPFKLITDYGADNGDLSMLQIRPLYTITTKNWNLINRPVIPIIDVNGTVGGRPEPPSGGGGDARGMGDISYTTPTSPSPENWIRSLFV